MFGTADELYEEQVRRQGACLLRAAPRAGQLQGLAVTWLFLHMT
jgi:hypothetical protein